MSPEDRHVSDALGDIAESLSAFGDDGNTLVGVTDGLLAVAKSIAIASKVLGLNDAATPMGAIEVLSAEIKHGSERIADAIENLAQAIGGILGSRAREYGPDDFVGGDR